MTTQRANPMIRANPYVEALSPYKLADLRTPQGVTRVTMAQNESLRPPSPAAVAAARATFDSAASYPDPAWTALRHGLAAHHGVDADMILCGAGSMELIACIARAYASADRRVLTSRYGYAFFALSGAMAQAPVDIAEEDGFTVSVDALLAAVTDQTRLVYLANPGNPTGTRIGFAEVSRLRSGLPADCLLVVDEAYGEFSDGTDTPAATLAARGDTVVLRTFSKAYGLASARIGYGIFPPAVAREVHKLVLPSNTSAASQAAAQAALEDQDYMTGTCRITCDLRDRFRAQLTDAGFAVPQSHTNFVLVPFAAPEAATAADKILRDQGYIMRSMAPYGLGACLRATVCPQPVMDAVAAILTGFARA